MYANMELLFVCDRREREDDIVILITLELEWSRQTSQQVFDDRAACIECKSADVLPIKYSNKI